jgi:hypothetical protein
MAGPTFGRGLQGRKRKYMIKIATCLLGAALLVGARPMTTQDKKSPDLQQQNHPETKPAPQQNQPGNDSTQTGTNANPDTQQDKSTDSKKKHRKHKNKDDAHQAHGTPQPQSSTDK